MHDEAVAVLVRLLRDSVDLTGVHRAASAEVDLESDVWTVRCRCGWSTAGSEPASVAVRFDVHASLPAADN